MSKLVGELSYKDWMIIKHGLKNSIEHKEEWIKANSDGVYETMEEEKKELAEEKATLERIIKLTDNFKDYIKGNERHYLSDPSWI